MVRIRVYSLGGGLASFRPWSACSGMELRKNTAAVIRSAWETPTSCVVVVRHIPCPGHVDRMSPLFGMPGPDRREVAGWEWNGKWSSRQSRFQLKIPLDLVVLEYSAL